VADHTKTMIDSFRAGLARHAKARAATGHIEAEWLLATCIDCRYPHVIHEYMRKEHPKELYDQVILAGASLALADSYTERDYWSKSFLEHIDLSIDLHNIGGVLIIDHRTCGAYREFKLLTKAEENTDVEKCRHQEVAEVAGAMALSRFRRKKKPGFVQVWLAPEVTDPAANTFPSAPEWLYENET